MQSKMMAVLAAAVIIGWLLATTLSPGDGSRADDGRHQLAALRELDSKTDKLAADQKRALGYLEKLVADAEKSKKEVRHHESEKGAEPASVSGQQAAEAASNSLSGTWSDGAGRVVVMLDGKTVAAKRTSAYNPSYGTIDGDTLHLYGVNGKMDGQKIVWDNGTTWHKVSDVSMAFPPLPPDTLPDVGHTCPGKDPKPYRSRTKNPFYLCTHGTRDMVSGTFIRTGWWLDCQGIPKLLALIKQLTHATKLEAVDVGGNIGTCSWVMAAEGAHVNTFEPAPVNLRVFEKSIELNRPRYGDAITLHHKGAGSEAATAKIKSESGNFGNSVVEKHGKDLGNLFDGRQSHWAEEETIHITRLDDEVKHHVHFMKMDCQGHEIEALLGARTLMMEHGVDVIRTEFDQQFLKKSGHAPVRLLQLLDEYGYAVVVAGKQLHASEFDSFAAKPKQTEIFALNKKSIDATHYREFY